MLQGSTCITCIICCTVCLQPKSAPASFGLPRSLMFYRFNILSPCFSTLSHLFSPAMPLGQRLHSSLLQALSHRQHMQGKQWKQCIQEAKPILFLPPQARCLTTLTLPRLVNFVQLMRESFLTLQTLPTHLLDCSNAVACPCHTS